MSSYTHRGSFVQSGIVRRLIVAGNELVKACEPYTMEPARQANVRLIATIESLSVAASEVIQLVDGLEASKRAAVERGNSAQAQEIDLQAEAIHASAARLLAQIIEDFARDSAPYVVQAHSNGDSIFREAIECCNQCLQINRQMQEAVPAERQFVEDILVESPGKMMNGNRLSQRAVAAIRNGESAGSIPLRLVWSVTGGKDSANGVTREQVIERLEELQRSQAGRAVDMSEAAALSAENAVSVFVAGTHELFDHIDGEAGMPESNGSEACFARMVHYIDGGDASVGMPGTSCWMLSPDQSNTQIQSIVQSNQAMASALRELAPWIEKHSGPGDRWASTLVRQALEQHEEPARQPGRSTDTPRG